MRRPFIRSTLAAGAIAAVMASGVAVAQPASAHRDGTCNSRDVCVWRHAGYTGGVMDYQYNDNDFRDERYFGASSYSVHDSVSSVWNYDPYCTANFYKDIQYGYWIWANGPGGGHVYNLTTIGWNDVADSVYWTC
jgi:hypothetical protein